MNTLSKSGHDTAPQYLAAIAIPKPQTAAEIAADLHGSIWYLVGEYPDMPTAMHHARQAALQHHADCYNVVFPDTGEEYETIRQKMRRLDSLECGNARLPAMQVSEGINDIAADKEGGSHE